jgi:hypothetical protein
MDEVEKAKDRTSALKRALAARPEYDVKKMFPEHFPKKAMADDEELTPEDYKDVKWSSPKDSPEEWERISKFLAERSGFMTGDDVVGNAPGGIEWTDWQ